MLYEIFCISLSNVNLMSMISSKGIIFGRRVAFQSFIDRNNIIAHPPHGNISFIDFSLILLKFLIDARKYIPPSYSVSNILGILLLQESSLWPCEFLFHSTVNIYLASEHQHFFLIEKLYRATNTINMISAYKSISSSIIYIN